MLGEVELPLVIGHERVRRTLIEIMQVLCQPPVDPNVSIRTKKKQVRANLDCFCEGYSVENRPLCGDGPPKAKRNVQVRLRCSISSFFFCMII